MVVMKLTHVINALKKTIVLLKVVF